MYKQIAHRDETEQAADTPDSGTAPPAGKKVHLGLKARILGHELEMGAPLREEDVASWFRVSRVPAREALRQLEQQGLIERSGRRYAIRSFSYEEVIITYRQRGALEFLAVEYAAKLGPEALAPVAVELQRQRQALPHCARSEFSHLDKAFHMAIARLSGQPLLVRELEIILDRVQLIRTSELMRDAGPKAAYEDHCRVFGALERGDVQVARAELEYHYATTVRLHEDRAVAPGTSKS